MSTPADDEMRKAIQRIINSESIFNKFIMSDTPFSNTASAYSHSYRDEPYRYKRDYLQEANLEEIKFKLIRDTEILEKELKTKVTDQLEGANVFDDLFDCGDEDEDTTKAEELPKFDPKDLDI
jgi:hypothetical protein